jgi:hypothetical protein
MKDEIKTNRYKRKHGTILIRRGIRASPHFYRLDELFCDHGHGHTIVATHRRRQLTYFLTNTVDDEVHVDAGALSTSGACAPGHGERHDLRNGLNATEQISEIVRHSLTPTLGHVEDHVRGKTMRAGVRRGVQNTTKWL